MNEATLKEQWRALIGVCPLSVLTLILSFFIALARMSYVITSSSNPSFIDITGLFGPWFAFWVLMIILGFYIAAHSETINAREKELVKSRLSLSYDEKY